MSAVNIFETPEGVMIFTDAAVYDADGVMVDFKNKVAVVGGGRLAITGRGWAPFPWFVAEALDRHAMTMDDVEEFGEEFIERGFEALEGKILDLVGKAFLNLWITGYSDRDKRAKVAQWTNCPPPGTPRFKLIDNVLAPMLTEAGMSRVRSSMNGKIDYAAMGVAVMKSQRLEPGSAEFMSEGKYLVGGHILRTDVTRDGITQRVVHEWPEDRVGERIRPSADFDPATAPNVAPIGGMSRQQRRRAEKLAKKGRAA